MSQYRTGTVTVTNGSAVVTGLGTAFIGNARAGHTFKISGENVMYQIAADAVNDLELTISPAYGGSSQAAVAYQIQRDFTPLGLAEISPNDVDWAYQLTQGVVRKVDSLLSEMLSGYAVVGEWNAATNTPAIPSAIGNNGKRYIVTVPAATYIDGAGPWAIGDSICSNGVAWFRIPALLSITAAQAAELIGGGNSILHYHGTDRDRANHIGTQAATTIAQDATHRFTTDAEKAIWNGYIEGRTYKGLWDALTDTPALPAAGVGNAGWYYRVSVAAGAYAVGDITISNGSAWERVASADAPAIHGADHLPGGVDPIPLATLTTAGLMDLTTFKAMLDQYIRVAPTMPDDLLIDGLWIDSSEVVYFAPAIANILPQSWLYAAGTTVDIVLSDVQDVTGVTLQAITGDGVNLPGTALHLSGTGSVRELLIDPLPGPVSTSITLLATNAYGLTDQAAFAAVAASQLFTITTSAGANGTISATQTVAQGGSITITATPDSTYRVSQLVIDGGDPVTGVSEWTFNDVQASHTVAATFAANSAPTISNIADQSTLYQTAGSVNFTIGDEYTPVANLVCSATSSNQTVLPDANIVLSGTTGTRTVTYTPATGQTGTATITVTVSDGDMTASDTFMLTVTPLILADSSFESGSFQATDPLLGWVNATTVNNGTVVSEILTASTTYGTKVLHLKSTCGGTANGGITQPKTRTKLLDTAWLQNFSFKFKILGATNFTYNSATAGYSYIALRVNVYDVSESLLTNTKKNIIILWGGEAQGAAAQDLTYRQNWTKDVWNTLSFDLKAYITANLNTGKVWADVAHINILPMTYAYDVNTVAEAYFDAIGGE